LKKAARLRPKEEFPLDYLAEAYARQQMYGDAAEAFLAAVKIGPESADSAVAFVDYAVSRFATMSARLRSSREGLAAEYRLRAASAPKTDASRLANLQRAADLDDSAPGIWSDLAWAALSANQSSAAPDFVHNALAADPNDLRAWMADARLAAKQSDWKHAMERLNGVGQRSPAVLSNAVADWPSTLVPPSAFRVSGPAAEFLTCVRGGQRECRVAAGRSPSATEPTRLFKEQRWEALSRLPISQHDAGMGWLHRGIALASLDQCAGAIPSLERAVQKSASEVYAMYLLSWCYSREAGSVADGVQNSAENELSMHVMRGDIFLRLQGKADLALAEYRLAAAKESGDPGLLERLAESEFGAGQIDGARADAEAALKIDPRRLRAKGTLAKIAMQERDYESALPYLRDLVQSDPSDLTTRVDLGRACAQTGALKDALENLQLAITRGYPDEKGSLHSLLGTVLKKMGRDAQAEQAFAEAARLSDAFQQRSYRDHEVDARP
jgi:tetratricopeptide (TPR) repeat protein